MLGMDLCIKILNRNVSCIWSDPDVIFLRDPQPDLRKEIGDVLIQRKIRHREEVSQVYTPNLKLFMARSVANVVSDLRTIKKMQHLSKQTIEECFHRVMCGEHEEYRLENTHCFNGKSSTRFLSWNSFLNEDKSNIWDVPPGKFLSTKRLKQAFTLQYSDGEDSEQKVERAMKHGLLTFDSQLDLCAFEKFGLAQYN